MLFPFTQSLSGAGLSWLYVWPYSVLLSVRSHDGSVYTMEIGNCYKLQLLPPQAVRIQLCCHYNCRIHTDQLDLFFKRQAGKPKTLLCPHCHTKDGETGASHLELIVFGTHNHLQWFYCHVPMSETTYESALNVPSVSGLFFLSFCAWSCLGVTPESADSLFLVSLDTFYVAWLVIYGQESHLRRFTVTNWCAWLVSL